MIGSMVDQFKIAKKVAKSPVGDKYLAVHAQTGAMFILQAVSPQLARKAGFRKHFLEDASRLIKFEHPNVVPLVNVLEENAQLYLVQEHFEGLSLSEMVLSQAGRLSLEGVLRLFKDILRGVGYAHAEGAVHRFLNPKNIIVTSDGDTKITGFGKVLPEAEEHLMEPEERAYAARYFSPERIRNPNTTDIRANIYALGAILYQLVAGKPPFAGDSFEAQAKQHIEMPVPDPSKANPTLTPKLVQTLNLALAKRPEDRFQNTIEFHKALEAAQQELAAKTEAQGGLGMGSGVVADADPSFKFDLPAEIQEQDFKFDLGSEVPTGKSVSDMMDISLSSETGSFDPLKSAAADQTDAFSLEAKVASGTSLDFSGFGTDETGKGGFDLDLQNEKGGQGALDFNPREKEGDFDLNNLSFGKSDGSATGAFDLGVIDASNANHVNNDNDETVQESLSSLQDDGGSLDFNLGSQESEPMAFGDLGTSNTAGADPFALDSEFPSEDGGDPFASMENSSEDLDLSFKGGELGDDTDLGSAESPLDLGGDSVEQVSGSASSLDLGSDDNFDFSEPALEIADGLNQTDTFAEEDPFTTDEDQTVSAMAMGSAPGSDRPDPPLGQPAGTGQREFPSDEDVIHRAGLEDSLAKIEAADAEAQTKISQSRGKVKKVRKLDKKLLALTAGLAAIVVVALYFWLGQQKQKREQERAIADIQQLVDQRQYKAALAQISDFMGKSSGRFSDLLADIQRQIRSQQRQNAKQIETLTERAVAFEAEETLLQDGKNDAYGTYHTILSLDPDHKEAREASTRIRELQLAKAESLVESERPVEALAIFAALTKGNRADRDTDQRYKSLKNQLKDSKSDTLVAQIENLYTQKDFAGIVPHFQELSQIDPKSDFVTRMRRTLVGDLVSLSKESLALQRYSDAEDSLRYAAKIDPNNKQVSNLLSDMGEERLRGDIDKTISDLEKAITSKDYSKQYRMSNELLGMDPGNRTAISALDAVKAHVATLTAKGEELREVGNFKGAASIYRQIYLIDKNEHARVLWSKFDNWTPPEGMAYVPAGSYKRGHHSTLDARPAHEVYISSFFMDKYEVTNREFQAFVKANPKWRPDRIDPSLHDGNYLKHWRNGRPLDDDLDRPVNYVSWYAASAYASFNNKRLPSEAEWEKAAAGNTVGKKYWWGNYSDAKMAVYEFYKENLPAPVGKFPANGFGVHEILGNVNEWNEDSYDPNFYRMTADSRNPRKADATLPERVFRGGSFRNRGSELMIFLRNHADPKLCHATLGFRCVMDAKTL